MAHLPEMASDLPRQRREAPRRRPPPRRPDPQVRSRQLVAVAVALVVLALLVYGVRSCRESRAERALTDYAQDSGALVQESNQLSSSVFRLLGDPGDQSTVELQSQVNGMVVQAARLADRAGTVEAPDDLADAHRSLAETLALRRDGVAGVARHLPTALADEGRREAARAVADDMRTFLASDVLYARRFRPALERSIGEVAPSPRPLVPDTVSLPDLGWLSPQTVNTRLGRVRSSAAGRGAAAPGLHGVALGGVTVTPAGTALSADAPVELTGDADLGFDVEVSNQGESEEDVVVRLTVAGEEGSEPIERDKELDAPLAPGGSETVSIPLAAEPPVGVPARIEVEVVPVPGEDERGNNRRSYTATFTPPPEDPDAG